MGDLCKVQETAKDIAQILESRFNDRKWKHMHEHLDSMVDLWMNFEHHSAWEQIEQQKVIREEEDATNVNLMADDMAEMRKMLMELSNMEDEA